jgi:hypothetical protein
MGHVPPRAGDERNTWQYFNSRTLKNRQTGFQLFTKQADSQKNKFINRVFQSPLLWRGEGEALKF